MSFPENEPSKLDRLQSRLYAKNTPLRKRERSRLSEETSTAPETFAPLPEEKHGSKMHLPPSFFKKIFIGSSVLFLLALMFAGFMWWQGKRTVSSDRIEINVLGNSFTAGGEELPLQVEIVNKNSAALELTDLLVTYAKSGVDTASTDSIRIPVGTIGGGNSAVVPVTLTLYGEEGTGQAIHLSLEYRIAGSNSVFVKETTHEVTLSSSPILLFIDAPDSIPPNQKMSLDITLKHSAANVAQGVALQIEYPFGFQFESATPAPSLGNNFFVLGDLPEGAEQKVHIEGTMFGEVGEERAFRVYAGATDPNNETSLAVTYTSLVHTLTLKKPFLEATLTYDGATGDTFIVPPGKQLYATISWANNLPMRMNNVELRLSLSGSAFDPGSVSAESQGFFESSTNTIIWSGDRNPDFATVEPGESGTVRFSFTPNVSGAIEDPEVKADISIKGNQSTSGNTPEEVSTVASKIFKVSTDLRLSGRVLYHSGAFANSGPLPPKANTETTYTTVWSITNTSNTATDAIVRAVLPIYVTWKGQVSPAGENVVYNQNTREVTWQPGVIAPKLGAGAPPREMSFQIGFTPSSSQVSQQPVLVNATTLSAQDNFTGAFLQSVWGALTTKLSTDAGSSAGEWSVVN